MPCSLLRRMIDVLDLLDDVGLNSLGRLVEQDDLRLGQHRAGDGELLLLAARQIAAAAVEKFFQHREQLEHLVEHVGVPAAARRKCQGSDFRAR